MSLYQVMLLPARVAKLTMASAVSCTIVALIPQLKWFHEFHPICGVRPSPLSRVATHCNTAKATRRYRKALMAWLKYLWSECGRTTCQSRAGLLVTCVMRAPSAAAAVIRVSSCKGYISNTTYM